MTVHDASSKSPSHSWFANPTFQLILAGVLNAVAELLLKKGANSTTVAAGFLGHLGLSSLLSPWTWAGIIAYIAALLSWLYVLRFVQLNIAFAVMTVVRLLVPIGAAVLYKEHVSPARWLGISLAFAGIFLVLKPMVAAEEKL